MRIAIYGASGFGRELVEPLQLAKPDAELVFVDDNPPANLPLPVLPFAELAAGDFYVIAIADSAVRRKLVAKCDAAGLVPYALVDPLARVGASVRLGEGAVICAGSIATADATIGRHFHCNLMSIVAHDCVIGDFVTFAPQVACLGNVSIGDGAYIGTGALLRQGRPGKPLRIGAGAVVGMGAVVLEDVPDGATVAGVPAKIIKRREG